MSVKAIYLSQQDVGKNVKSSKKKFIWKFSIDDKEHTVELYVSSLSGKKKVVHNGRTLTENSNLMGGFSYGFSIGSNMLTVQSVNDSFDLRINSLQFSHLYHTERTKKEFEFEGGYKEANNNFNDEYVPPKRNVNKTQKPLYKESEESYDLGIADGFEQMAPKEYERSSDFQSVSHPQARLNLKINNQKESGRDGFDGFNNKFSKPTQQPAQQQAQVSFAGFGDFGKQTDFQKQPQVDNVFGNFGFNFEQPTTQQQPKTNPFGPTSEPKQQAPQVAPVVQQPPPVIQQAPPKPAVQSTNLIDFLEDLPETNVQVQQQAQHHPQQSQPQQQQQQISNKAPITKDLLDDLFGDDPAPQQQPATQPIITPVTQQQPTLSQGNPLAALYNQSNIQAPQQQSTVQSASINILNAYNQPQNQQPQMQQQPQQYQQPQRQSIQQAYAPYQTYQQPQQYQQIQQPQQYQQPQYQQPQQYQQQPQYVPQQQYQAPQQNYQAPPQYHPQQSAPKPQSTPFDDLF